MTDTAPLRLHGECSLYIDLGDPFAAVAPGDWLATPAGSRYLVLTSRHVVSRGHAQRNRWRMRVARLDRDLPTPADVTCWTLQWYPRRGRARG